MTEQARETPEPLTPARLDVLYGFPPTYTEPEASAWVAGVRAALRAATPDPAEPDPRSLANPANREGWSEPTATLFPPLPPVSHEAYIERLNDWPDAATPDPAEPGHAPYAVWTWDQPYVACGCGWEAVIYDGSDIRDGVDWGHENPVGWTAHLRAEDPA